METIPLVVNPAGVLNLSDDELFRLCAANPEVSIERTSEGELIFMAPAGGASSNRNSTINLELGLWNRKAGLGKVFDSNGGFVLPNGAMRAPDAAWVPKARWEALSPEQREKFPPLCPDFVIELRSRTDRLGDVQEKMAEYMANGARLGWLIDPYGGGAYVYRPARRWRSSASARRSWARTSCPASRSTSPSSTPPRVSGPTSTTDVRRRGQEASNFPTRNVRKKTARRPSARSGARRGRARSPRTSGPGGRRCSGRGGRPRRGR